jgi:hypothetical protein
VTPEQMQAVTLGIIVLGFVATIISNLVRSPKETMLDHESRIRELERESIGDGPLREERHRRHEAAIEDLTLAMRELSTKFERWSQGGGKT